MSLRLIIFNVPRIKKAIIKNNSIIFSLMSLRLIIFNVPRIKKAIIKNNSIILVPWCLCGKIPE